LGTKLDDFLNFFYSQVPINHNRKRKGDQVTF